MTPSHLTTLRLLAADEWNISREDREAVQAILAEREAVLRILLPACHSGVNVKSHGVIYRALQAMGERE